MLLLLFTLQNESYKCNKKTRTLRWLGRRIRGSLSGMEDDTQARADRKGEGIIQTGYDFERRHPGEAGGHQQLGTIRNHSLHHAGKGIQQARSTSRRDSETFGNVPGDLARRDDGDGIVGRAQVDSRIVVAFLDRADRLPGHPDRIREVLQAAAPREPALQNPQSLCHIPR